MSYITKKIGLTIFVILFPAIITAQVKTDTLRAILTNRHDPTILVVSHRGDWRNAPENSLQAIKNCIKMGVDIVEIDLKKTKDGEIILMHDNQLDRTTTGKGAPSDYTYDEIQRLYLKNGAGHKTSHKIPTLRDVMLLCKGNILVNIDKGYEYFDDVLKILKETGTTDQCILKSTNVFSVVNNEHGKDLKEQGFLYMPVIDLQKPTGQTVLKSFLDNYNPVVYEINFDNDQQAIEIIRKVKATGAKVYVNSLWPELCSGHNDDKAVESRNTKDSWGWLIKNGCNLIQTDRPFHLLQYLREKGLHE